MTLGEFATSSVEPTPMLDPRRRAKGVTLAPPPGTRSPGLTDERSPLRALPALDDRRRGLYERFGKRAFDIVGASAIIVALSPVLLIEWLMLRIVLGPNVIITQERVGRNGEVFGMYKFRTMHWSRREAHHSFAGPDRRVTHKADHDPRHTPIGRLFRKLSVDELPQLLNVLNGDMSLVGPRPELATIVEEIHGHGHRRHSIRPGMTGEWQVTTRQTGKLLHECFDEDLPYLERITLRNDLSILWDTVAVVSGQGGR